MGITACPDRWRQIIKVYLFRHAAVEKTYQGSYNGHIDIDASQEGLREAKKNFKAIDSIPFDAVFCSTLKRARQTLSVLDIRQNVFFKEELKEKSWGRHEGKSYDEIVALEGKSYENFSQWLEVLDGEPFGLFRDRIKLFVDTLCSQEYENILIVTHAGVINTMMHIVEGLSLESAFQSSVSYGSYYLLAIG